MSIPEIIAALQDSAVGEWMRNTRRAMPMIEAAHVLAAVTVFGSVLVVDLRLLGWPDARRAFTWISRQMLPLTWAAFGIAVVTGSLMFTTVAATYAANRAFQMKMLALICAGLNMAFFQLVTLRGVSRWDTGTAPRSARVAGLISILLWAAIVLLGRWIGFTKRYAFSMPAGVDLDFSY